MPEATEGSSELRDLLPEIAREIRQVAHFGSAPRVKELVTAAGAAIDTENYEDALASLAGGQDKGAAIGSHP